MENNYKTKWVKEPVPYGSFEDYVTMETDSGVSFTMHQAEFDWIAERLYDLYQKEKKIKYIQILREWNETTGFEDIDGTPSTIVDILETIAALSYLEPLVAPPFGEPSKDDIENLKIFLKTNESSVINIRKE